MKRSLYLVRRTVLYFIFLAALVPSEAAAQSAASANACKDWPASCPTRAWSPTIGSSPGSWPWPALAERREPNFPLTMLRLAVSFND